MRIPLTNLVMLALLGSVSCVGCSSERRNAAVAGTVPDDRTPAPEHVDDDRLFEFRSRFWINLHHFLHAMSGRDLPIRHPRLGDADVELVDSLDPSQAALWERAIDFYRAEYAQRDLLFDAGMREINAALAAQDDETAPDNALIGMELARELAAVAPVYRDVWWARHDDANHRWTAAVVPLVDRYGPELVPRLDAAYQTTWPEQVIPTDVCAYAGWAGAYTTSHPLHITIASLDRRNRGLVALETMFHEAAHTFDHVMQDAIVDAARRRSTEVPDQLWHAIIFYTSGVLVQRVADPAYEPYADRFGLWLRGPMPEYHRVLQTHWLGHLDGTIGLEAAVDGMVEDLK